MNSYAPSSSPLRLRRASLLASLLLFNSACCSTDSSLMAGKASCGSASLMVLSENSVVFCVCPGTMSGSWLRSSIVLLSFAAQCSRAWCGTRARSVFVEFEFELHEETKTTTVSRDSLTRYQYEWQYEHDQRNERARRIAAFARRNGAKDHPSPHAIRDLISTISTTIFLSANIGGIFRDSFATDTARSGSSTDRTITKLKKGD